MIKFLKTKILLVLSSAMIWFFGSPGITHALLGLLTKPFEVIIEILMFLILGGGMSYVALVATQGILNWVASPNFIKVSFTGADNVMVTAGWTVVRDFTNLLFILVLIVIGLMTALRTSKEYQVQKTLPILIGIALLINFTPVICGVIIDASNIIMNFFLSAGTEGYGAFVNFTDTAKGILTGAFKGLISRWRNLIDGTFLFQVLFFIIFNIVCSFIFLIMAGLLLIRHIALWILVIFAPLAFFSYILPATRKIWHQWWHNFIQWCFVGVGGAFFLYLTQVMLGEIENLAGPARMGADENFTLLGNLLLRMVPMILLGAGVFVTMSTSAMGANVITGAARKLQGKALGGMKRYGGKWAGRKIKDGARWAGNKVPRGIDRGMGKLSAYRSNWGRDAEGKELTGIGNWARRTVAGAVSGSVQGLGRSGQVVTSRLGTAQNIKARDEYKKVAAGKTYEQNLATTRKTNNPAELLAQVMHFIESKQIKDAIKSGAITPDKLQAVYETAVQGGPDMKKDKEAIERSFGGNDKYAPVIAKVLSEQDPYRPVRDERGQVVRNADGIAKYEGHDRSGLTDEDKKEGYKTLQEKIVAEARSKDDFDAIVMDKKELARIVGKHGTRQQVGWASDKHGPEFREALQEYMTESYKKAVSAGDPKKIFDDVSEDVMRYAASNTGDINPVSKEFDRDNKITKAYREYRHPGPTPLNIGSIDAALAPTDEVRMRIKSEEAEIAAGKETVERRNRNVMKAREILARNVTIRDAAVHNADEAANELQDLRNAPTPTLQQNLADRNVEIGRAEAKVARANEEVEEAQERFNDALRNATEAEEEYRTGIRVALQKWGDEQVAKTGLRVSANPNERDSIDPSEFYRSVGASQQDIIQLAADPGSGFNFTELTMAIQNLGTEFGETFRTYIQDQYNQNQAQNREIWRMFGTMNKETMLKFFTTEGRRLNGLDAIIDQQTQTAINLSEDEIDAYERIYKQNNP